MTEQDDILLFRESLHKFIANEVTPHYAKWEKAEIFPRRLWNQLGEQGFLAVDIPEQYGGFGASFSHAMEVIEALARFNLGALASSVTVHSDIVAHYIVNQGSEAQKQHYLPKMMTGECVGAVAMTEPGAGSDLQAMRTKAIQEGDEYVINGSKTFITNGQHSDVIVVAAKTDLQAKPSQGISLFLVDANTTGFKRGRNLEKIGLHSGDTSELFFDDMRVPASALLGQVNQGFVILMKELQRERLSLAAGCVAGAEGVIKETIDYTKQRQVFGQPLAALQNTKFALAQAATDCRVHRAFLDECKGQFIQKTLDVATVSMAKLACSEMQGRVADACLQLYGGYGYMEEYGVSRAFADARIQRIYGGTSEIMKELISRDLLRD